MKKYVNKFFGDWTNVVSAGIVAALLSAPIELGAESMTSEMDGKVAYPAQELNKNDNLTGHAKFGEVMQLNEELNVLQSELLGVLTELDALKEENMQLKAGVVGQITALSSKSSVSDLSALADAFRNVSSESHKQASQVIEYCNLMKQMLKNLNVDDLGRYKITEKLRMLEVDARRMVALINSVEHENKAESCEVLSISDKLRVVVLNAGYRDGLRFGQVWQNGDVKVQVINVRPLIAAAMFVKGGVRDVIPGQRFVSGMVKNENIVEETE